MSKSRIVIAGAALFVTFICWSLGRPINGPRDERFHIASVWCAQGINENCQFLTGSGCTILPSSLTGRLCVIRDATNQPIYLIRTELCVPKNIEEI